MVRIRVQYSCDYKGCWARVEVDEHERPEGWSKTSDGQDRCPKH